MRMGIHTWGAVVIMVLVLTAAGQAQQQKTGYVDTDLLLSHMPEYQGIQQELRSLGQQWRNELRDMQREIDLLKEDFAAKEILYTEELRNQKVQEIETSVRRREEYLNQRFGPEGDYFKRQQELLEPIQRRIFEAIAVVAEREGYDFVFDRSQHPMLLYAQPEWDLNDEVLLQLGINPDDTSN